MSRSEYNANLDMQPKSYSEGFLDGRREALNRLQRQRDRNAYASALMWIACICTGFAVGTLTAALRWLP